MKLYLIYCSLDFFNSGFCMKKILKKMYKNKFLFFFFLIGYFMLFLFVELIFNNINYVYILLRSFCVFLLKICKKKISLFNMSFFEYFN